MFNVRFLALQQRVRKLFGRPREDFVVDREGGGRVNRRELLVGALQVA
jgi:hypothetical protein